MEKTNLIKNYFNHIASSRDRWKQKSSYYHKQIEQFCKFIVPTSRRVLEIGSATGDLLASLKPEYGIGIDIANKMTKIAKKKYPHLKFITDDAQNLKLQEKFDYIILSDLIGNLEDIQKSMEELRKVSSEKTRIIFTYYNFLWEPLINFSEFVGFKMPQPDQNWLSRRDIENLLLLSELDIIKKGTLLLFPIYIPFISNLLNKFIAKIPIINNLCLVQYFITRRKTNLYPDKDYSVSVILPARNEAGNIEQAIIRTPKLGNWMELIFVEKGSKDGTYEEVKRISKKYPDRNIHLYKGSTDSKGAKVRQGFAKAKGDILMILDSDLTTPPEDLPKFYQALRLRKGEMVIGSRLVYPMEKQAMRFLNILGNKFFSLAFTFLLDQPIKDTLCGTKALFKKDYEEIARNRSYFGDFDPYGDYDLIFGASKMNLKIIEIPVRYKARTYGTTNISRFSHGFLLLRMTVLAARRLKFI